MQLMPRTASFVARQRSLRGNQKHRLFDPEFNMDLGQRYLGILLNEDVVGGDLFRLATAYNAGPGNLGRLAAQDGPWQRPHYCLSSPCQAVKPASSSSVS